MEEAIYYNALAIEWRGVREALKKLKDRFGTWKAAYLNETARQPRIVNPEREFRKLDHSGARLVLYGDPEYPAALTEIADPPFGLYIKGVLPEKALSLAVVGTRKATPEGLKIAKDFSRTLGDIGIIIVSGLAFGIDASAHAGALDSGGGKTIAVLATGLHMTYPQMNGWLARRILEKGGAILSEYPLGEPPLPYRFLERNRIVSGLSKGVVVVEAPESSGSLATARYALEQNRDVFVVPGNILHPNFKGSHALIRQGAELVTSAEEILSSYGIEKEERDARIETSASEEEKLILNALRSTSTAQDVDKLSLITKLDTRIVNRAIGFLLIKHLVKETEYGYTI